MENKIQTIRESLDAYRTRIASEGFDENSQLNQRYYPYDNHGFALKAGSDIVKKVLEESGKFKFNKEIIKPSHNLHIYSWDYLATDAVILANCTDKGGEDRNGFCDRYDLDPKIWTPMTLHPYQSSLLGDMSADKDSAARAKLGKNSTMAGVNKTRVFR